MVLDFVLLQITSTGLKINIYFFSRYKQSKRSERISGYYNLQKLNHKNPGGVNNNLRYQFNLTRGSIRPYKISARILISMKKVAETSTDPITTGKSSFPNASTVTLPIPFQ